LKQCVNAQVRLWAVEVDLVVRAVEVPIHDDGLPCAQRRQIARKVFVPFANPVL